MFVYTIFVSTYSESFSSNNLLFENQDEFWNHEFVRQSEAANQNLHGMTTNNSSRDDSRS